MRKRSRRLYEIMAKAWGGRAQMAKPRERRCLSRGSRSLPGAHDQGPEGPHRLLEPAS